MQAFRDASKHNESAMFQRIQQIEKEKEEARLETLRFAKSVEMQNARNERLQNEIAELKSRDSPLVQTPRSSIYSGIDRVSGKIQTAAGTRTKTATAAGGTASAGSSSYNPPGGGGGRPPYRPDPSSNFGFIFAPDGGNDPPDDDDGDDKESERGRRSRKDKKDKKDKKEKKDKKDRKKKKKDSSPPSNDGDDDGDDGSNSDDASNSDDSEGDLRGVSSKLLKALLAKKRVKVADSIEFPSKPDAIKFKTWWSAARTEIASAVQDETMHDKAAKWFQEV